VGEHEIAGLDAQLQRRGQPFEAWRARDHFAHVVAPCATWPARTPFKRP
jgi:hypothetical protein